MEEAREEGRKKGRGERGGERRNEKLENFNYVKFNFTFLLSGAQ